MVNASITYQGKIKMKTNFMRLCFLLFSGIIISACNSGNSDSNSAAAMGTTTTQVINIDANQLQQEVNPNVISGTDSTLKSTENSCLAANTLVFDSSSSVWYMSGSFKITNTCSSSQQLNGTQVRLMGGNSNDVWNSSEFKINSFTPWLGNSPNYIVTATGNQLQLKINNSYLIAANQTITVNYGYTRNNKPLTTSGASVTIINGNTPTPTPIPPPVNNSALTLTVNASAMATICTVSTPCNISINMLDSTGKIYKTITTITSTTGNNTYSLPDIIPGSYSLAATNLPAKVAVTFTPFSLQLGAGQTGQATASFSVTNPGSSCLSTTMGALNSSSWWLSGSFTIKNDCNTSQTLGGTTIALNSTNSSDLISSFQINSTAPYIANFASIMTSNNSVLITINNNAGLLTANGSVVVNFAYSPQGVLLKGNLITSINGSTPVANAALTITIDSSALSNYCTTNNPCNIPVILANQTGSFSKTLTTITNSTGKVVYNISNLNPGTYIVSSNNLPTDLLVSYSPAAMAQLASGESKAINAIYTIKPATTGQLSFAILNPQANIFTFESIPVMISGSTGNSNAIQAKLGQSLTTILNPGTYSLSVSGLASASKGLYYSYPVINTAVSIGQTTTLGNISAVSESNVVNNSITINGLSKGDSVTLAFTDNKYIFNKEIITATQESIPVTTAFKFIKNDIVTFNIMVGNSYQNVAPVTVTINPNQNYTITVTKIQQPSQQIVGYFETWMATATWESATYSLAKVPSYVGIIPVAFAKPDSIYTAGSYNFSGAGLGITATKDVAIGAIKLAQAKGQKLLLSVGGATYPNFAAINVPALMALVKDLNLDGIDLDYEADTNGCSNLNTTNLSCPTDSQMINIINQLRSGLDQIQSSTGRKMYLTAAVWSIGAYGTPAYPTTQYGPVGNKSALWVNPLKQVGAKFDMLFLMSYDAGNALTTGYRPLDALKAYKNIYSGPVYLGVEVPPEAWGGNVTTPQEAVTNATTAIQLGGAGTMIWALQVQGMANGSAVNSMSYLQPICRLYNLGNCDQLIPLN